MSHFDIGMLFLALAVIVYYLGKIANKERK